MSARGIDLRALSAERPVHFVGIGGAGMCALAELLLRSGGRVSGCDVKDSESMRHLAALGASVHVGHDERHVDGISALVVTSAVPQDHPELVAARREGLPVLKRADALGAWVSRGRVLAVAGTHGKTTTTAMATEILAHAGLDPTGLVGGRVADWQGNLRFGSDSLFVVEADEYDRSFLQLTPDVAIVTNVEADHLDVYGDYAGVVAGFRDFLDRVRGGGRVVVCADDHGASSLLARVGSQGYTYGTHAGSMLRATRVTVGASGTRCSVVEDGESVGELVLPRGGLHSLLNALGASAAARSLGVEWPAILEALAGFTGVARRFEPLGEVGGVRVVDDYAHHPTEIAATLRAARSLYGAPARLVAVFQPHLYSRTRDFAEAFGEALAGADVVWVTDVFPAREQPIPGVSGELVANAATAAGARVRYHPRLDTLAGDLLVELRPGDVVLTLGAGSIETLGRSVLELLQVPIHA